MDTLISTNKKHTSMGSLIGYVYLTILSIESGLTYTDFQLQGIAARVILLFEIILFIAFVSRERYTKKALGIIFSLVLIGLISYATTGYTQFVNAIMTAIIFQKMNYKKGFKYLFFSRLIMMVLINGLSLIGIIDIAARNVGKSYGKVLGYGLGYNHPNRYAYSYMYLELAFICWKNKRLSLKSYSAVLILGIVGYLITQSRTLLVLTFALILLCAGFKSKQFNKIITWVMDKISVFIYPLLAFFSLLIPYIILTGWGPLAPLFTQINQMISYRFSIISRVFEYYRPTLFGGVNEFDLLIQTYNYNTVDNGYIRLLFGFGIVGLIVFLILFALTIKRLIKESEYIYIICAFVIAFWGLAENILINDSFNIAILFWGVIFNNMRIDTSGKTTKRKHRIILKA